MMIDWAERLRMMVRHRNKCETNAQWSSYRLPPWPAFSHHWAFHLLLVLPRPQTASRRTSRILPARDRSSRSKSSDLQDPLIWSDLHCLLLTSHFLGTWISTSTIFWRDWSSAAGSWTVWNEQFELILNCFNMWHQRINKTSTLHRSSFTKIVFLGWNCVPQGTKKKKTICSNIIVFNYFSVDNMNSSVPFRSDLDPILSALRGSLAAWHAVAPSAESRRRA